MAADQRAVGRLNVMLSRSEASPSSVLGGSVSLGDRRFFASPERHEPSIVIPSEAPALSDDEPARNAVKVEARNP